MELILTETGRIELAEQDRFDRLAIVAPAGAPLSPAFDSAGVVAGEHVWLDVDWLAGQAPAPSAAWLAKFAAMIDYADQQGWMRDGRVRVHVRRRDRGLG